MKADSFGWLTQGVGWAIAMVWGLQATFSLAASTGDARCAKPGVRARHFSARALPEKTALERYQAFLGTCAQAEVVALTQRLVSFQTVSSERPAAQNPHIAAMGRYLQRWASTRGLQFRTIGQDDVFEIGWGRGEPRLGLITHGDVVPAPAQEWTRKPFEAVVEDGKLYGRGTEDDKGPLATALVSLAFAQELGLTPRGRLVVVVGNGEESDWTGMKAYAASQPQPTYVVSLDSGFPVVSGQSGFVAWGLQAPLSVLSPQEEGQVWIREAGAGEFLTQVPGTAWMRLAPRRGWTGEQLEQAVRQGVEALRRARPHLRAELTREEGEVRVTFHGKAVHSSTAEAGHNALWDLSALAASLPVARNGWSTLLMAVAHFFDQDHWGQKLGLSYQDPFMGPLLVAPTVLKSSEGTAILEVNMRRPQGMDSEAFRLSLRRAADQLSDRYGVVELPNVYVGEPHLAAMNGPLVSTLLDIYRRHRPAEPRPQAIAIRGGTYARLFKGAVDFGPSFPGEPYAGHAPDEYIRLDTLGALTSMLGEAIYRLGVVDGGSVSEGEP